MFNLWFLIYLFLFIFIKNSDDDGHSDPDVFGATYRTNQLSSNRTNRFIPISLPIPTSLSKLTPTLSQSTREHKRLLNRFFRKPYLWNSCMFLVLILKFIFTAIFKINIPEKKSFTQK